MNNKYYNHLSALDITSFWLHSTNTYEIPTTYQALAKAGGQGDAKF